MKLRINDKLTITLTDEQVKKLEDAMFNDHEWSPRQLDDDMAEWPDEFEVRWERNR